MAGYEDQAEDLYYLDEPAGSFDQDLVYALDAGVRHTVNQALAQAIQPIKHHLLGFVEQQGWIAPSGSQSVGELPLPANTQASNQSTNPHSADFESFIRNMAREHDYNSGSQKKAVSDPASSSEQSSEQGDDPPRKRKKKSRIAGTYHILPLLLHSVMEKISRKKEQDAEPMPLADKQRPCEKGLDFGFHAGSPEGPTLRDILQAIMDTHEALETKIDTLATDMRILQEDQRHLAGRVTTAEHDLADIPPALESAVSRLSTLKQKVKTLETCAEDAANRTRRNNIHMVSLH
ncbi:hypothetical protein NDU88_004278 [Pleurodeles waltl]|uniref:Uncharacterized protein n=1 Tax=Pleurodeles waltl TaxID=8319 RepID=A0AAV7L8A3_PLEWA|nr:hypothetical protein NDU88_004278 [Pleurodeles waltl]